MNINVCDVCYNADGKLVESKWKVGFPRGAKVALCAEHKDWGKDLKGRDVFYKAFSDLEQIGFNRRFPNANPTVIEHYKNVGLGKADAKGND